MEKQHPKFVKVTVENHPFSSMACEILGQDACGLFRLRLAGTEKTAWLSQDEFSPLQVGDRVIIEVQIYDFFEDAMMVAGGWMTCNRILSVVNDDLKGKS